jgi:exopolysaccharide biosynthesis polyprenyl glycosylphosphotransferase
MPAKNNRLFSLVLVGLDFTVLASAFVLAYIVRVAYDPRPLLNQVHAFEYMFSLVAIVPLWIVVFASLGLYSPINYNRRLATWGKIILGCFVGTLLVIGWEYVGGAPIFPARLVAAYAFGGACVLIVIERELARLVRSWLFERGRGVSRVLLVGHTAINYEIIKLLSYDMRHGYQIVAVAGPKKYIPDSANVQHYPTIKEALKHLKTKRINTIIQTSFYEDQRQNQTVLNAAQNNHINYCFIPGEPEFYSGKNEVDVFLNYPIIKIYQTPLVGWGRFIKRIFDTAVLVISAPIWLTLFGVTVILQKLFNPGPVFFKHKRLGRYNKVFQIYKFRSMAPEYSTQDAVQAFRAMGRADLVKEYQKNHKVKDDPRITRFGRFLRASSLDELAQVINILKGNMSLVGPRPVLPDEIGEYQERGALLLSVKPGLTGLWAVSGRSNLSYTERINLELYYTQNWSFWLDIKILLKTIRVVLTRRGSM